MAVVTLYRLAEQALSLIEGGDMPAASSLSINEIKIACGQVINKLLKTEHMSRNLPMGEMIPNGAVIGTYTGIAVSQDGNGSSKCTLPIKPILLPRNMGIWSVYPSGKPQDEFIPMQMGQNNMLRSQPMINELLGQTGYEAYGEVLKFNKDLTESGTVSATVDMRLVVMDISQYDDYTMLPVPPEWEWDIITEVYKMYSLQPIPDKVIDSTQKELIRTPINQQSQPE